ncbi:hypothetical protein FQN54_006542 [Arachnomyces sp. PD_36]|nr:hypothetical protein FQN54_006542 [Arachnomyces sp. PD_36]
MAGVLQGLFGGDSPSASAVPGGNGDDADFADFAGAPEPAPASIIGSSSSGVPAFAPSGTGSAVPGQVPFTKWYRVWERTSPQDFVQEAFILPFIFLVIAFHVWGTRKNRSRATSWVRAHLPTLQKEFAVVGFGGVRKAPSVDSVQADGLLKATAATEELVDPVTLLKEKTATEFGTYATGRQNVAFVDISIQLLKRYNPVLYLADYIVSIFFDGWPTPVEKVDLVTYTFDGKEKELVPVPAGDKDSLDIKTPKGGNSSYDGFVWAIAHKNAMRKLRSERYDVSMTFTKDNPKLPAWTTVMSESAEITDTLLTPELIKAVEQAGESLEYLIITDQPIDKPTKIDETTPKKRLHLSLLLPSSTTTEAYTPTLPLFTTFLRLPDQLASMAHFRPEVMRKLRSVREEEIKKLRRADEDEKAEERKIAAEKLKKEERERLLRGMSAEEQKKYLEREREKEVKKGMKKGTRKG